VAGIGVVINPAAGGNRQTADRLDRLARVVGSAGWVRETRSLEHLPEVAEECRQSEVDLLAVCGGDGTYTRTLSALHEVYAGHPLPTFLPLRAGTMNTVARSIGAPRWQPERMLAQIVAEYRQGQPLQSMEHQLLRVNDRSLGFMVGAGVVVGFLEEYYQTSRTGPVGASALLARLIASVLTGGPLVARVFRWIDASMTCDDVAVPFQRFSVLYASSIEDIGLGFRPTYRAREQRGRFHLFAGPLDARELVNNLGKIRRGMPTGSPKVHDATTQRLQVRFGQPTSYMIDGEIMPETTELVVETGPILRIVTEVATQ
jgi:diacylglycerol kinase family enzyme